MVSVLLLQGGATTSVFPAAASLRWQQPACRFDRCPLFLLWRQVNFGCVAPLPMLHGMLPARLHCSGHTG